MVWAQGVLLMLMSGIYLVTEVRLRRATRGRTGVLDHVRLPMAVAPPVMYAAALILFSLGGWRGLSLTSALTCAVLPIVMGGVAAAVRPDLPRVVPTAVAVGCCLASLIVLTVGTRPTG